MSARVTIEGMSRRIYRRRRSTAITIIGLVIALFLTYQSWSNLGTDSKTTPSEAVLSSSDQPLARESLPKLIVKGRAPKTGYERAKFGSGWETWGDCDTRQRILARDLTEVKLGEDGCTVLSGRLNDPYTGTVMDFKRGSGTSSAVQIDHVVALSDAWQKGAQNWDAAKREALANDDLELLAVDGAANQQKSDGDAATWLPSNKVFRCQYVARQIAVKLKYELWVTQAEYDAMARVLDACPAQRLPAP